MLSYEEAQAQAQVLCSLDRLCAYNAEHRVFHVFKPHLITEYEPFHLQLLQL